jgi:hypothetical protein
VDSREAGKPYDWHRCPDSALLLRNAKDEKSGWKKQKPE